MPNARGGGYVLGKQNVDFIGDNYEKLEKWNSEDISVGAWLAAVKVNRVHSNRFDTEAESRGCHNSYIVTHKQVRFHRCIKAYIFLELGRLP